MGKRAGPHEARGGSTSACLKRADVNGDGGIAATCGKSCGVDVSDLSQLSRLTLRWRLTHSGEQKAVNNGRSAPLADDELGSSRQAVLTLYCCGLGGMGGAASPMAAMWSVAEAQLVRGYGPLPVVWYTTCSDETVWHRPLQAMLYRISSHRPRHRAFPGRMRRGRCAASAAQAQ